MSGLSKFDLMSQAVKRFIVTLHRPGIDRGQITTFGSTFRVEQDFTSDPARLCSTLAAVSRSITNEKTRLYDSLADAVSAFYAAGQRNRPWVLCCVTDGCDNASSCFHKSPAGIGQYLARSFNHDPTNFLAVVAVGTDSQIDRNALAVLGQAARCPCVTINGFELIEQIFKQIALRVTSRLVGLRHTVGNISWDELARIRQISRFPIDFSFLLDRSGSMAESAPPQSQGVNPASRSDIQSDRWWEWN
jgi:hypothetical protein